MKHLPYLAHIHWFFEATFPSPALKLNLVIHGYRENPEWTWVR